VGLACGTKVAAEFRHTTCVHVGHTEKTKSF